MECEYHELSYMKASLELVEVKEDIDQLMKEKHVIEQKLERKNREQNELADRCTRHIKVLKRKGLSGDYYCPKKRGVMVTPTKTGASSYAPNYVPSPKSYDPNYVQPPQSGTHPQDQIGNIYSQGGLRSPIHNGQLAPCTPGSSPSRFTSFHPMGGLLNSRLQTSTTPAKVNRAADALICGGPPDSKDKKCLIIKNKRSYHDNGVSDKEMLAYVKQLADEEGNNSQSASGDAIHTDVRVSRGYTDYHQGRAIHMADSRIH